MNTFLLAPRYVVPVRPAGVVLHDNAVAVRGRDIMAVGPLPELQRRFPDADRVDLSDHVLLPGLVNAHTHAAMNLLRGWADDLDLRTWLNRHIWPAERRWVGPEFVAAGTRLALAESLRGGVTCINDDYFHPGVTGALCQELGVRAMVGVPLIEAPNPWVGSVDEAFERADSLFERARDWPLVDVSLAPHAPYSVSDATLERVATTVAERGCRVHMHVLESAWEVDDSLSQHQQRPLERLDRLGLLDPHLVAVHMTQLIADDPDRLAEAGVHVVHCPESNLKLASGVCPVPALLAAGVNVAIGTDGAASNNDLDVLGEARTAALLAKGLSGDPEALPAPLALELATLGGARALGIDDRVGTIETGREADLVAIDLAAIETQPLHDVISQVIYATGRRQVSDAWVAGRRLLAGGRLVAEDEAELLALARSWHERMSAAAPVAGAVAS